MRKTRRPRVNKFSRHSFDPPIQRIQERGFEMTVSPAICSVCGARVRPFPEHPVASNGSWMERTDGSRQPQHASERPIKVLKRSQNVRGPRVVMLSTPTQVCRNHSLGKSISGFFFVIALGIGLLGVKTNGLERPKAPEVLKAPVPSNHDDVLSAADALEWRQEFLWHRTIAKICPNPWI